MEDVLEGYFYTTKLPDGRWVAASSASPYFCLRADSEEAAIKRVGKIFSDYGEWLAKGPVEVETSVTTSFTTLRAARRVPFSEAKQYATA